jgi:hypothetical protein
LGLTSASLLFCSGAEADIALVAQAQESGIDWLFTLAELDSTTTRLHPTCRVLVPQALQKLRGLLVNNAKQQRPLLELLRRHPHLISTLYLAVTPNLHAPPSKGLASLQPKDPFPEVSVLLFVGRSALKTKG